MSQAVISVNWETHWLIESFPGTSAHPSIQRGTRTGFAEMKARVIQSQL